MVLLEVVAKDTDKVRSVIKIDVLFMVLPLNYIFLLMEMPFCLYFCLESFILSFSSSGLTFSEWMSKEMLSSPMSFSISTVFKHYGVCICTGKKKKLTIY